MAYTTGICGGDVGMVDYELEAAEALAGLAHSAIGTHTSSASDASEPPVNLASPPPHSAVSGDDKTMPPQHSTKNSLPNMLRSENEFEISPSVACTFDYPSVTGSKSRQNLTEAEKEARRLRRVLANRESARQTIRRRQAMHEELTKKAADLALENENLKREKELAAKQYDCLKSTNNTLKAQMTSVAKEEEEHDVYDISNSTQAEISTAPNFFYNHSPLMPCIWRPIFQPLESGNIGEPTPFLGQESNPATPFYVLPFPWIIPFHAQNQYFPKSSEYNETSVLHQCSASSPKTAVIAEQPQIFLPVKDETEDLNSIHKDDCKEVGFGFLSGLGSTNGVQKQQESNPKQAALVGPPLTSIGQVTNAGSNVSSLGGEVCDINFISSTVGQIARDSADAIAAMDARKKRKEIMKLKNLHCRPYHLH